MGNRQGKYTFYGGYDFDATWEKFRELLALEGKSISQVLRTWINGYVKEGTPVDPQKPLTEWVPEYEAPQVFPDQEIYDTLARYADRRNGEVAYAFILNLLRDSGIDYRIRLDVAEKLAKRLSNDGMKVLR